MNDEEILQKGGNEDDIKEYAAINGADMTKEDFTNLVYLDVETTGLDLEDKLCEVAFCIDEGEMEQSYFHPPLPIKIGAMAVSHITNTMVADAKPFAGSEMQKRLIELNYSGHVMVAHNAPFDLSMLERDGVIFDNFIDTKKLSHALDKDDTMESHRLQYLRYYYGIEMPEAAAHSAEGDVKVLRAVYHKLVEELGNPTIEEQLEISRKPILYSVFKFGKYKGQRIGDVARTNPQYIEWLLNEKKKSDQAEVDWVYTLEHYLRNHA